MATIEAQIEAQTALLQQILTAMQSLSPAKPEDFAPVTTSLTNLGTAIGNLQATANAIAAKLPVDEPAASA